MNFLFDQDLRFWLKPDHEFTIGRKVGCSIIKKAKSISRVHVTFKTAATGETTISDESKWGTMVGSTRIVQQHTVIGLDDEITLGKSQDNVTFRIAREPIVICITGVAAEEKKRLVHVSSSLGFVVSDAVDAKTTHLISQDIAPTRKLLHALSLAKPIVSPAWLFALEAFDPKIPFEFPDIRDFLPPLQNESLSWMQSYSLLPNCQRTCLFAGKSFLTFSREEHEMVMDIVVRSGGEMEEFISDTSLIKQIVAMNPDIIIVLPTKNRDSDSLSNAIKSRLTGTGGIAMMNYDTILKAILSASAPEVEKSRSAHDLVFDIFDDMMGTLEPQPSTSSQGSQRVSQKIEPIGLHKGQTVSLAERLKLNVPSTAKREKTKSNVERKQTKTDELKLPQKAVSPGVAAKRKKSISEDQIRCLVQATSDKLKNEVLDSWIDSKTAPLDNSAEDKEADIVTFSIGERKGANPSMNFKRFRKTNGPLSSYSSISSSKVINVVPDDNSYY